MANEDVLRLRATVVSDEALAQIRAIGREIGLMPRRRSPTFKAQQGTSATLASTVKKLGGESPDRGPGAGQRRLRRSGRGMQLRR